MSNNDELKQLFEQQRVQRTPQDADTFWKTFRVRAAEQVRERPARPSFAWRPALLFTAIAVMVAVAVNVPTPSSGDLAQGNTRVKKLEVFATHSATIIMESEDDDGTVVWIADMKLNNGESRL